ncbi:enoyl-CoA hydratase-related protein [Ramlibacter albus]|uniref:Enoyl-CoA hydratase/isomerase family protein n=1 Tax=Ramlibacter albus TaxID=2079448 RepID=A0A923MBB4_9BURK|nr:enoyl-CoA hydratase-related protein [Ramlibacter albus]MBC5767071.1 enoyl-CoA hydratase/isomerase family protein [Ramlibacter albus]
MEHRHVTLKRDGDIAVVTLDNPARRNALSRDMQHGLLAIIHELREDKSVRAVLLTASGNAFCAGADLAGNAIPAGHEHLSRGEATQKVMEEVSNPIITGLRELPVPVVCAIPGVAAGAGVGIALAADIVVAARSAYFYLPFIPKLGIVPDLGTTWFLQQLVGRGRAAALTLLGDRLSAEKAEQWGVVWACMDDADLADKATQLARQLAKLPAGAALETRRAYEAASRNDLRAQLQYEADRQRELLDRPEFDEGVRAFLEKREPRFHA